MKQVWLVDQRRAVHRWTRPGKKLRSALRISRCRLRHHSWGDWRVETEHWFEQPVPVQPHAWRVCQRCRLIQTARRRLTVPWSDPASDPLGDAKWWACAKPVHQTFVTPIIVVGEGTRYRAKCDRCLYLTEPQPTWGQAVLFGKNHELEVQQRGQGV